MRLKAYAELTKFEHTIFALPFLLAGIVLLVERFSIPLEALLGAGCLCVRKDIGYVPQQAH
jgi:4-hydroxybenzoate polyprenyltransferase